MTILINDEEFLDSPISFEDINSLSTLDERGLILQSHLIIENFLEYFIKKVIRFDSILLKLRLNFNQKLTLAKNIGLRPELVNFCKKINSIRNKFSHQLRYKITKEEITDLKSLLNLCFPGPKTNVTDETRISMDVTAKLGNSHHSKTLDFSFNEADDRGRLVMILHIFIGNNFLIYLHVISGICAKLDARSTDRVNDFIVNEKTIKVTGVTTPI